MNREKQKVSVHGVKNIIHYSTLERQLFHPFLSKPNRLCRFCERLVIVTPDLLRKSTPEGLFAKQFRVDKSFNPPECLQQKNAKQRSLAVRKKGEAGFSLLEYVAGATVLVVVVWGAMTVLGRNLEGLVASLGNWASARSTEIDAASSVR